MVQPLLGSFCSPDIIGGNRNLGSFVCCPPRHFLPWGRASEGRRSKRVTCHKAVQSELTTNHHMILLANSYPLM